MHALHHDDVMRHHLVHLVCDEVMNYAAMAAVDVLLNVMVERFHHTQWNPLGGPHSH